MRTTIFKTTVPLPQPKERPKKKPKKPGKPTWSSRSQAWGKTIRSYLVPLRDFYVRFCEETTLHGLKHTVADHLHWFERWLWLLLTVCAFLSAVYCALNQLSRYNSEPVVVSMQRDYRSWWTAYPAVTACFVDRMQQDRAREAIEKQWNVTEDSDPEKFQYYYSFVELVSDVSFRTNLQNFWKYQSDESVMGLDLLRLAVNVHPTFALNVMMSKSEKEYQWVPVMTEMGICMSFNSMYAEFQILFQDSDWSFDELLACHYHSEQCYVRIDSLNNAVKYFIHSPFDVPSAISNPTGEVLPGEELVMDFKAVEIQAAESVKKLRSDQRRCRYPDEWLSDSIQSYSFGLCQMHCRSRMAIMFCGCRPYFHVKGASFGGTTALFVGASVLTVVETILFFVRYFVNLLWYFGDKLLSRGKGRIVQFKP